MADDKPKSTARPARTPTRKLLRRWLAKLKSGGDVRTSKIQRLRAKVRARRYENTLKIAIAADRLLAELDSK